MKKVERVEYIISYLDSIYPDTPIPLTHQNHYELLIAVLLSAQCTDERVNQVTPSLFSVANKPDKMIKQEYLINYKSLLIFLVPVRKVL